MGLVDVQRAIHSMTLPPRTGEPHEWPAPIIIEGDEPVAIPIHTEGDEDYLAGCPELDSLTEEEQDEQARRAVVGLAGELGKGPEPFRAVVAMLELGLDLDHCCADRLFWHCQERGYVSLSEGVVHLGRVPVAH